LRNEAHRFGITHHRNKGSKKALGTELTDIVGIGEKTAEELLKKFKSVKRVREADPEQIEAVIGKAKATVLLDYLSKNSL